MCKVIAIMNEKGGVGKTATATSLAYLLRKKGYHTALIDYDGQGHSSIIFGIKNPNQLKVTINTLIRKVIDNDPFPLPESYIIKTNCGVDLIPSNSQLFTLERNLSSVDFREHILSRVVDHFRANYDYIIIDCMPQMGTTMINVMMCADSIIIPTQAEILSAQSFNELLKHYQVVCKNSNHLLKIEGILITMDLPRTNLSLQVKEIIQQGYADVFPVFKTHIPRSVKVGEATLYNKTIFEFMPDNPVAIAYNNFVEELIENDKTAQSIS